MALPPSNALLTLATAVLLGFGLTPAVIRLAHARGWVSLPRSDRWNSRPVALLGGLAIVTAFLLAALASGAADGALGAVACSGAVLLGAMGFIDDRRGLGPRPKLLVELAVASAAVVAGVRFAPMLPDVLSVPLTIVWIIGVTNALNLLDNMDGLAGGAAAVISLGISLVAAAAGAQTVSLLALCLCGACVGYLPYNYRRARVFMGDAGSLPLGFLVALLSLVAAGTPTSSGASAVLLVCIPIVLCALPIIDTSLVTFSRLRTGRRVSQGGRDHASHRLVYLGLGDTGAVVVLHIVAGFTSLCAVAALWWPETAWLCVAIAVCLSMMLWLRLSRVNPYIQPMAAQLGAQPSPAAVPHEMAAPRVSRSVLVETTLGRDEAPLLETAPRHAHSAAG